MTEWWEGLTLTLQILYCIAIPASLVLAVQAILLLIGMGGSGEGINPSDTSGFDGDASSPDMPDGNFSAEFGALQMFSLQGIMIFFSVFGWSAILLTGSGAHPFIAIGVGLLLGFLAMYGVARLLFAFSKLAQSGTFETKNLLGAKASVYVPIPPKGKGRGKVMVALPERYMEFFAETDGAEMLATNTSVRIVDVRGDVLVVETDD